MTERKPMKQRMLDSIDTLDDLSILHELRPEDVAVVRRFVASFGDESAAMLREIEQLRAERVQLQGENESLRADLEALRRTNDTLLDEAADVDVARFERLAEGPAGPTGRDKTDIEALAARLAKVENRLAEQRNVFLKRDETLNDRITEVAETIGERIADLVEKTGGTIPGFEPSIEFGRGDEVRLDMAQSQGGRRLFGWYVVEAIRTDTNGYTVQVSAPERADPKPLFWIKPEDVLEVRHPTP